MRSIFPSVDIAALFTSRSVGIVGPVLVRVCTDEAHTQLADITSLVDGAEIPDSTLFATVHKPTPMFYGPDGVDSLWMFNTLTGSMLQVFALAVGASGGGADGTPGQPRFTGSGPPTLISSATSGDLYLDYVSGTIYQFS